MAATLGVVVVAAGRSARMLGLDKVFVPVLWTPLLAYSLETFQRSPRAGDVVVVVSEPNLATAKELIAVRELTKIRAVVAGGARRQDSVRNGLNALPMADWVAVHDGARPFVDEPMIERGMEAVAATGAAVAAIPVRDTIKQVDVARTVTATPPREGLWAAQTPQVFGRELLEWCHREVVDDVTDDAAMVERLGGKVVIFEGSPWNIKVTTREDLVIAEAIAAHLQGRQGAAEQVRYGTGFDGHRLVPGGPLRIGGTDVPFDFHLEGHSDGDVLLHSVASAVLGGAGLGDLGQHFPSSDPSLKGIDSRLLLQRAVALAGDAGWLVEFVDATIIAQRPKLASYLQTIARSIAGTLGVEPGHVNVKATSTDNVGAIGQGEGIAAQAIATVRAAERRS
ncbi:MAG: 2-C-methyl-D-erythritol 4-phosphate cytidylyltransferase [Chloroflexi bacterium]|nr:2-C-methyl-D-erythritol 4-phosphate cytidylyltransferase [Chloroflexota bacterium]